MNLLPEWHSLVVAAVDGEISHADRKKLREILNSNGEARQLLRSYRAQAKLLSEVQTPPLPCDFASVFRNEPEFRNGEISPNPKTVIVARGKLSQPKSIALASWVALALSLLLVLGVGLALLNQPRIVADPRAEETGANPTVSRKSRFLSRFLPPSAKSKPETYVSGQVANSTLNNSFAPKQSTALTQPEIEPVAGNVPESTPRPNSVAAANRAHSNLPPKAANQREVPPPGVGQPTLLTAPYSDPGILIEPRISVPTWISWEDLRIELDAKSGSKTLFLEIPCNDTIVVSNQFIQILKNKQKGILVDRLAQDRLVQKNIRSHFGVCLENVDLPDLEKLLVALKSDVENIRNKTAIPYLGKGIALFPEETEAPAVFQFSNNPEPMEKSISQFSDLAPNPILSKSPGKSSEGLKNLLQPTMNNQGKVDALILAQSPYYPEVRSSSSSQEITLYRKLMPTRSEERYRVIIFLRQLHI